MRSKRGQRSREKYQAKTANALRLFSRWGKELTDVEVEALAAHIEAGAPKVEYSSDLVAALEKISAIETDKSAADLVKEIMP